MKIVLFTIVVLVSVLSINLAATNSDSLEKLAHQNPIMKIDSIIYIATTRGFYEKVSVNRDFIKMTNDRDEIDVKMNRLGKESWNSLLEHIAKIPIENIEKFQAPTNYRATDGAAFAHLEIYSNGEVFQTPNFDHGYPPKEISTLVKELQSLRDKLFED